jgi:hypothetical protein
MSCTCTNRIIIVSKKSRKMRWVEYIARMYNMNNTHKTKVLKPVGKKPFVS